MFIANFRNGILSAGIYGGQSHEDCSNGNSIRAENLNVAQLSE
jgi:hypothetical protein